MLFNQMVNQLMNELNFDFNNPSYKKLDQDLSEKVRKIYSFYASECHLDKNKPIYSPNGVLIANSFDRIVIGDYGPYIEFTEEQSNKNEFVVATGQEYRLTPKYNNTIKYEWYSTKEQDCKLYWQLRTVVYADYKPHKYYISPFEVHQKGVNNNMNTTKRIIIAGGREFNNYELLKEKCDYYLSKAVKDGYKIAIVSGKAKGADSLGEKYAKEKGYAIDEFPANWDKYKKKAGYLRNEEMAKHAKETNGALIAFWDKKSKGTKHMIDLAKKYGLHIRIVYY